MVFVECQILIERHITQNDLCADIKSLKYREKQLFLNVLSDKYKNGASRTKQLQHEPKRRFSLPSTVCLLNILLKLSQTKLSCFNIVSPPSVTHPNHLIDVCRVFRVMSLTESCTKACSHKQPESILLSVFKILSFMHFITFVEGHHLTFLLSVQE